MVPALTIAYAVFMTIIVPAFVWTSYDRDWIDWASTGHDEQGFYRWEPTRIELTLIFTVGGFCFGTAVVIGTILLQTPETPTQGYALSALVTATAPMAFLFVISTFAIDYLGDKGYIPSNDKEYTSRFTHR